jgi:hypothetical protein
MGKVRDHVASWTNRRFNPGELQSTSNDVTPMASMTTAQIVARLLRDGHGDLALAVRDRTISAHSASVLAGYSRRRPTKSSSKRRLANEAQVMGGRRWPTRS